MKKICATCGNVIIRKDEGVFRCGLRLDKSKDKSKITLQELRNGCPKWARKEKQ